MIFFGGHKKQKKQLNNPMNSWVLKLGALLFIGYIISTDYRIKNPSPVTATQSATPAGENSLPAELPPGNSPQAAAPAPACDEKAMQWNFVRSLSTPVDTTDKPEIVKDPGVEVETLGEGNKEGPVAGYGDTVIVRYIGMLENNSVVADTRETPATFVLGDGSVIPGLEQAIAGMREGEIRQVIVPPAFGYKAPFANDKVPADATLGFLVNLVDIQSGHGKQVERLGFKALDEKEGQGAAVKPGDKVRTSTVIYNAHGMELYRDKEPREFVLGQSKEPQDYAEGITGMKPGGKRILILPPSLLKTMKTSLPNYELMHIEVELLAPEAKAAPVKKEPAKTESTKKKEQAPEKKDQP